jgi:hypothetical protein
MSNKKLVNTTKLVWSHPAKCIKTEGCRLESEFFHEVDADPEKGHWTCPNCGTKYPFREWKICSKNEPRGVMRDTFTLVDMGDKKRR